MGVVLQADHMRMSLFPEVRSGPCCADRQAGFLRMADRQDDEQRAELEDTIR